MALHLMCRLEIEANEAHEHGRDSADRKRERIKQLGNAVTPPVMQMILTRCLATLS